MLLNFRKMPEFFERAYRLEDRFRPHIHVPFAVNSAQRDLLELCAQIQDQRQLVWLIAIKPRRVGLSRVISGIGTSIAFHQPGTAGVVMAQLGSTLGKIMTSYSIMSRGLPTKVKIDYVSAGKGGREISTISIGKGKRPSSIVGSKALATGEGRGDAAQFMQLTEAAHYPPQSPFTAMLPSVPRSLDTFVGIESTPSPDRRGIAFREMWEQARWITDTRRDALFVRYFCPWMKDPYAFADPKIARDAPLDDDERALMAVGVDRAQIAWRRMEIRGRYRGKKELFEQENPSDPMSCFMQTETPAFSPEERAYAKSTEETPPKVGTGMFEGSGKSRGDFPIRIKLGSDNPWWRFYEEPQKRCEYYIGVDAARGFDGFRGGDENRITDFAAIVVINGSTNAVAAVLEARIPPDHVARQVALAGKFYRTREISEYHYALINIAITDGFGSEVLRRVRDDYDYPIHRFLRWRGRDDRIHNRPGQNIGWIDTEATNALRVNTFRIALGNEQFVCRDSKLIEQIHSSSMTGYGDAEVVRGHDDVLDACMYAWIARDMERPREIIDFNASETTTHRMMIKLANDPQATFNQLWKQMGQMARPDKPNRVGEMIEHINGKDGVFV